jgi:hypothetical protein
MAQQPLRRRKADKKTNEFYETMPLAQRAGWAYRDAPLNDNEPLDDHAQLEAQAKITAIVTLVIVAVVAIAMGLVLLWAAQAASQNLTSPNQSNATRLEL